MGRGMQTRTREKFRRVLIRQTLALAHLRGASVTKALHSSGKTRLQSGANSYVFPKPVENKISVVHEQFQGHGEPATSIKALEAETPGACRKLHLQQLQAKVMHSTGHAEFVTKACEKSVKGR